MPPPETPVTVPGERVMLDIVMVMPAGTAMVVESWGELEPYLHTKVTGPGVGAVMVDGVTVPVWFIQAPMNEATDPAALAAALFREVDT